MSPHKSRLLAELHQKGKDLVTWYGKKVKPARYDHSRTQGAINAARLMQEEGIEYMELRNAIQNYAEFCSRMKYLPHYRKNVGNFFGMEKVYLAYLPATYEPVDDDGEDADWEQRLEERREHLKRMLAEEQEKEKRRNETRP